MILTTVKAEFDSHMQVLEQMVYQCAPLITDIAIAIAKCFQQGNKLLLCGNGGSAADAQHVAAEFINRFRFDRGALPAVALTTDSSILTCIANDSAYENIFARQVEALVVKGDVLAGISTSGRSANVLKALDTARSIGAITIGFTGECGGQSMASKCDFCLAIPSNDTARIQECHEFTWHVICGIVEQMLFPKEHDKSL